MVLYPLYRRWDAKVYEYYKKTNLVKHFWHIDFASLSQKVGIIERLFQLSLPQLYYQVALWLFRKLIPKILIALILECLRDRIIFLKARKILAM